MDDGGNDVGEIGKVNISALVERDVEGVIGTSGGGKRLLAVADLVREKR